MSIQHGVGAGSDLPAPHFFTQMNVACGIGSSTQTTEFLPQTDANHLTPTLTGMLPILLLASLYFNVCHRQLRAG